MTRPHAVAMMLTTVFLGALSSARAVDWDTNLPSFSGGAYDGWDRCLMTNAAHLGDAWVSLSSGEDQTFSWATVNADLAALTIEAAEPAGSITGGVTMRLSVPSAWNCRFDTGSSVSYDGDASGKVSPASFSGDGRTLLIPVTDDFVAGDDIEIEGLRLLDLALCPAGEKRLELDFTGNGIRDVYDQHVIQVTVGWAGGSYDGWDRRAMTNAAYLGDAWVSLSSGENQSFSWTTANAALATLTIEAIEPAGSITGGVTMRLSVPSAWNCRFDPDAAVSYDGSASAKVSPASFSGDGRTLLIPVTSDFNAADTLEIAGLGLLDLALCPAGAARFELDFTGNGIRDIYDQYTIETSVEWAGGAYDGWDRYAMEQADPLGATTTGSIFLWE